MSCFRAEIDSQESADAEFPGEVRVPNLTEGIILLEVDGRTHSRRWFTPFGV